MTCVICGQSIPSGSRAPRGAHPTCYHRAWRSRRMHLLGPAIRTGRPSARADVLAAVRAGRMVSTSAVLDALPQWSINTVRHWLRALEREGVVRRVAGNWWEVVDA